MNRTQQLRRFCKTVLLCGGLLLTTTSAASESRMSSLSNNPQVSDITDIADFPGMLSLYANTGFLTVKPLAPGGNAALLIGNSDVVFGVWILRDPRFDDIRTADALFPLNNPGNMDLPNTYNIADVFVGTSSGFGIRASVGAGLRTQDNVNPDDERESTGASALTVELQPGFTLVQDNYQGDFGLGLTLNHFQIVNGGDKIYTGRPIPSVLLRHRSIIGNFADTLNWVADVLLTRRSYAIRHNPSDDKGHVGDWMLSLVLGPRFNLPSNFTVTTGFKGQLEIRNGRMDGDRTPAGIGIGTPGVILSAELWIRELLAVRAGADYDIFWGITRFYDGDDDLTARNRVMGQRFSWSAGLGLMLGSFTIDGMLRQTLLLDGPDIIGGRAPGFLGMLSATYNWQ
jgi:hypothetical protein